MFHNGGAFQEYIATNKLERIIVINGYIPYEYVVPRCKLVVFTGSVCLQNICMYHSTPMLFVPVLNEQFFWARNYKHHTGIDYIDFQKPPSPTRAANVLTAAMKPNTYLLRVQESMRKRGNNAAANIAGLLRDV